MSERVALLRGINVGGNNIVPMAELRADLEALGLAPVRTYIQSGNVLFTTDAVAGPALEADVERVLEERFGTAIMTVVRSRDDLAAVIDAPRPGTATRTCGATCWSSPSGSCPPASSTSRATATRRRPRW